MDNETPLDGSIEPNWEQLQKLAVKHEERGKGHTDGIGAACCVVYSESTDRIRAI